jgi:protein-L-isoaspartate O-methyltransferase
MSAPGATAGFWRAYASRLATTLQEAGEPMRPQLRAAIQAVPRHLLTPPPAHPVTGERETPRQDDLVGMAAWYADAYTPGYNHEPGPQPGRGVAVAPGSPAWVARVLHAAEITSSCRVLEVGPASGYLTALLATWLGSAAVYATDADPDHVMQLRQRLCLLGLDPTLAVARPATGKVDAAPFDRIIATDPVAQIPRAWIEQAGATAIVLAHLRGALGAGGFVVLRPGKGAGLSGRFQPRLEPVRRHPTNWPEPMSVAGALAGRAVRRVALAEPSVAGSVAVEPQRLGRDAAVRLLAQALLPRGTRCHVGADPAGRMATYLTAPDGSWLEITHDTNSAGRYDTRGGGPTPLQDEVQTAWTQMRQLGNPRIDEFGITASCSGCRLWHGSPSGRSWRFPGTPTQPYP